MYLKDRLQLYNLACLLPVLGLCASYLLKGAAFSLVQTHPTAVFTATLIWVGACYSITPLFFRCPECGYMVAELVPSGRARRWAIPDRCPNCSHFLRDSSPPTGT